MTGPLLEKSGVARMLSSIEATSDRMAFQGEGQVQPSIIPQWVYDRVLGLRQVGILPPEPTPIIVNDHREAALQITTPRAIADLATLLEENNIQTLDGDRLAIEGDRSRPAETLDIYIADSVNRITKRARLYSDGNRVQSVRLITADFSNGEEDRQSSAEAAESFFRDECVYVERWDITEGTSPAELAQRIINGLSSELYVAIVYKEVIRGNFGEKYMWDHRSVVTDDGSPGGKTQILPYLLGMKPYIAFVIQEVKRGSWNQLPSAGIKEIIEYALKGIVRLNTAFFPLTIDRKGKVIAQETQTRLELEYRGDEYQETAIHILQQILQVLADNQISYQPVRARKIPLTTSG